MRKTTILILLLFLSLGQAQEPSVGIPVGGGFDLPATAKSRPTPRGTSAPANCAVGELFFDTDAAAGENLYGCTATDTWTLLGDGGGVGGGDDITVNGAAAADADFDDTTPAAPANGLNVVWQKDALSPNNISAHILQNAGTDVTVDLEEETHASEHAENGDDELLGEALGTACTENQILKANATGGLDCAADATGGSPTFDQIGSGTNTTAAMVVGSGASLRTAAGILGVPNSTTLPGTCTVGDVHFDNDAALGLRFNLCTALNTWTAFDNPFGTAIEASEVAADVATQAELDTHTSATAAHGATGAVVGTTNEQTLSGKTLTTPIIGAYTVGTLPAAGTAGRVAVVTDAASAGSCTAGSGSAISLCRDSGAAWIPLGDGGGGGGGDSTKTHYEPLTCNTPDSVTNPGATFWSPISLTNYQAGVWQFLSNATSDPDGTIFCHVGVPNNLATTPAAAIVLVIGANNTTASKNVRVQVSTAAVAATESMDASLTAETAQTILMPTTAYARKDVTFTLTNAPAAFDHMIVKIFRDGNHADDNLDATNLLMFAAFLKIDLTL